MTIALPLTDFSSGRTDPRGDTTQRESRFRRRCQSRRAGYKSDYRNIANVIFPASGCEPSCIGDVLTFARFLLNERRRATDRYTARRNSFCKIIVTTQLLSNRRAYRVIWKSNWPSITIDPHNTIRCKNGKYLCHFFKIFGYFYFFQILLTTSKLTISLEINELTMVSLNVVTN